MRTIRRLIYREVLSAVLFVAAGFLALFFFFDFVDELPNVGKGGIATYRLTQALLYITLLLPNHLYELLPIAVLIGTIFVMARLAQSSEYTILRTSGLGPGRALRTLLVLGLAFAALTFAVGDYVTPVADKAAQLLRARYQGRISIGQTGAWLKERQQQSTYNVNVAALAPDGSMQGVRLFEADDRGHTLSTTTAPRAVFGEEGWVLQDAEVTRYLTRGTSPTVEHEVVAELRWPTRITPEMVSVALLKPDRMSTVALFEYIQHLEENGQTSQRYEIEFWRKVFYPLSCLVMVVMALPFAYLHFRAGGITSYVFVGVLIGISFFLLNNVFGYVGNLRSWWPWLTAAAPGLLYSLLSLGAFGWLVLRR